MNNIFYIPTILIGWNMNWLLGVAFILTIGYFLFHEEKGIAPASMIAGIEGLFILLSHILLLVISILISRNLGVEVWFNELESILIIMVLFFLYIFYKIITKKYYKIDVLDFKKILALIVLLVVGLSMIIPLITLIVG